MAIESILADVRYAIRGCLKKPAFAAMAILSLALGIGANTAIFSLVDSILLKLPARARQLTTLVNRDSNGPLGQFSWPKIEAIRSQTGQSFSCVFGYSLSLDGLAERSQQPRRVFAGYVSGNFFSGLGLKPAVGRVFLPGKEKFRRAGRRLCSRAIIGSREAEIQRRSERGWTDGDGKWTRNDDS